MAIDGLQVFAGWSNGYQFGLLNTKEDEVRQGANYYMGAVVQASKLSILNAGVKLLVEQIPDGIAKTAGRVACSFAPYIGFVGFLSCAAVKSGHYDVIKDAWTRNKPEMLPGLPRALSERVVLVCNVVSEHSGDIMRVIAIVSAVALAFFVNPSFGVGMLVGLGLEAADSAGMIPRKISLFMERYLPVMASIGTFIYGGFIVRVFTLMSIVEGCAPASQVYIHHRIDDLAKDVFGVEGIRLSEYEAPLQDNKQMTYDEILRILNNVDPLVMDPAHCSKRVISGSSLPEDRDFDKFLTYFDTIDWASKYEVIKGKLSNDDRFTDFLSKKFPNILKSTLKKDLYSTDNTRFISFLRQTHPTIPEDILRSLPKDPETGAPYVMHKSAFMDFLMGELRPFGILRPEVQNVLNSYQRFDDYYPQFEGCIQTLAQEAGISKEAYAARWMREQMVETVNVLMDRKRVKGQQEDLQDAIDNAAKIIPYLEGLDPENDKVEIEDCLMKLAVEGGDYCARGLKRATNEIIDGIVSKLALVGVAGGTDEGNFEMKIRSSLQELRYEIIQRTYKERTENMQLPGAIAMDVHMMDAYRASLFLGFFPLTEQERRNVGVVQLIGWERYTRLREAMVCGYNKEIDNRLQETILEVGEIHFANYANQLILANENLTPEQKTELTDRITENWEDPWIPICDLLSTKTAEKFPKYSKEEKKELKKTFNKSWIGLLSKTWGRGEYESSFVKNWIDNDIEDLTAKEKGIIHKRASRDWNKISVQTGFRRLALVSLGILKKPA